MIGRGFVALVGRPNTGKSTLFNRLTRSRAAIVEDQPGVTRDRHYGLVRLDDDQGGAFNLIDTGGFEPKAGEGIPALMRRQVQLAIDEADVVVLVADGREGATPLDHEIANHLRRSHKPVILAVNKLDSGRMEDAALEFYELGLGDPLALSAEHGRGMADLLDLVIPLLPPAPEPEAEDDAVRVAVIGRPNVGKSSLVNQLVGSERVIVSDISGTTRDALDVELTIDDRRYILIDTAGFRRPGKVGGVEKWSVLRALKAIDRADVAIVMSDATDELTDGEARVAGLAEERGRAVVFAFNKWDLIEDPDRRFKDLNDELEFKLKFLAFIPRLVISAKTGRNVRRLMTAVDGVYEQYCRRAATADVNRVLEEAVRRHQPPYTKPGRRLKFYFATQAEAKPPTFIVFTNYPENVHFSYARYLQNQFRQAFGLEDIPIRVKFRPRNTRGKK